MNTGFTQGVSPELWIGEFRDLLAVPATIQGDDLSRALFDKLSALPLQDRTLVLEFHGRLFAAYKHLLRHLEAYNVGRVAVLGDNALLSGEVLHAYYLLFAQVPFEALDNDWPPEAVLRSAQKLIAARKASPDNNGSR